MKRIRLIKKKGNEECGVWHKYYLYHETTRYYHVVCMDIDEDGDIIATDDMKYRTNEYRYEVIEPESEFPIENCNCWNGDEDHTGIDELNPYGPFIVQMEYDGGYIATDKEGHPHRWDNYEVIKAEPMTAKEISDRVNDIGTTHIKIMALQSDIASRGIEE